MKLSSFEYQGNTYDLYNFSDCERLYHDAIREISLLSTGLKPGSEKKHVSDIDKRSFAIVVNHPSSYYINKLVVPDAFSCKTGLKAFIKVSMVSRFLKKNDTFTKFIYTTDKYEYQTARGLSREDYERFDLFDCCLEVKKRGTEFEKTTIRHAGTILGKLAYQKLPKVRKRKRNRRSEFRNENTHFIRVLMYGPKLANRPVIDPFNRALVEGIEVYNDIEDKTYTLNTYTLHHCLFVNGTSVYKDGAEPSKALNGKSYTKFDSNLVYEFMGMIALGEDGHKTIHKAYFHDDIQGWIRRYSRGEVFWIPHHWLSESNYNETVEWLCNHIEDFDRDAQLSYNDFITSLSFSDDHKAVIEKHMGQGMVDF